MADEGFKIELTETQWLALFLGIETLIRALLSNIAGMTPDETQEFIKQKEAEKAEHDQWLRDNL